MDEQTAITALLIFVGLLTLFIAGIALWMVSYVSRMSARFIQTSNETAASLEKSVERIEAMLKKQRADAENQRLR